MYLVLLYIWKRHEDWLYRTRARTKDITTGTAIAAAAAVDAAVDYCSTTTEMLLNSATDTITGLLEADAVRGTAVVYNPLRSSTPPCSVCGLPGIICWIRQSS